MAKIAKTQKVCEDHSGIFWAAVLILLGIFFSLYTFGIINLASWPSFKLYWPIFLILAGVAFLFKKKGIGWILILLTIILGIISGFSSIVSNCGEERSTSQKIDLDRLDKGIKSMEVYLGFGAGEISIGKTPDYLYINQIHTRDQKNPIFAYESEGSVAQISVRRSGGCFFGSNTKESWDVKLFENMPKKIKLSYGAARVDADLRGLSADSLEINAGASSTRIVFDDYTTNAKIDIGASEIKLEFPKTAGIKVTLDIGATSHNFNKLDEFVEKEGVFSTKNYELAENKIQITIDAGASSIESSFY